MIDVAPVVEMAADSVVDAGFDAESDRNVSVIVWPDADVIVRFQGGNNAAHTLVVDGEKFILRLVPAGALYSNKTCVIGNGTVVDPLALLSEIDDLKKRRGLADDFLKLSYEAHIVFPYHRAIDLAREARAGKRAIGTTGFGIGPAYEDKIARRGIQIVDLFHPKLLREKLERALEEKNALFANLYRRDAFRLEDVYQDALKVGERLKPFVSDVRESLVAAIANRRVLARHARILTTAACISCPPDRPACIRSIAPRSPCRSRPTTPTG